jgi:mitochondrial fission protein ELM1
LGALRPYVAAAADRVRALAAAAAAGHPLFGLFEDDLAAGRARVRAP